MALGRNYVRIGLLTGLCLLARVVLAAESVTYPPQGIQVFLGLDDTSAPTQVQDGRAQDIQNVTLDAGAMRQRYGIDLVLTPDSTNGLEIGDTLDIQDEAFCAVTGVYYTKLSSGTELTLATCGNRLYELNGVASWDNTGNQLFTGGQNNQFVFTVALDNILLPNDVNTPFRYDGTTLSSVSFTGLSAGST